MNTVIPECECTKMSFSFPPATDFLRHARCNRNVTLDEAKCAPAYRKTLELAKTVSEAQDVDRGLRRSCWSVTSGHSVTKTAHTTYRNRPQENGVLSLVFCYFSSLPYCRHCAKPRIIQIFHLTR